jgi:hypothetical protein
MRRFAKYTEDGVFVGAKAAQEGIVIENLGKACQLALLRYFGPEVNPQAPEVGAYRKG